MPRFINRLMSWLPFLKRLKIAPKIDIIMVMYILTGCIVCLLATMLLFAVDMSPWFSKK